MLRATSCRFLEDILFQVVSPIEDMKEECSDFNRAIGYCRPSWPLHLSELSIWP